MEFPDTLKELKDLCLQHGLKTWGSKEQIKNRLSQKLETERESKSDDYYNMSLDNLKQICKERKLSSSKCFII